MKKINNEESIYKGYVINSQNFKESDQSITLFTYEWGLISFVIKGSRKITSKHKSLGEHFVYGEYYLTKSYAYKILKSGEIIDSALPLRKDYFRLNIGLLINKFIYRSVPMDGPHYSLFKVYSFTLKRLETSKDPIMLFRYFIIKSIIALGFNGEFEKCNGCGGIEDVNYYYFNDGFFLCQNCGKDGFMLESELVSLYFNISIDNFKEVNRILKNLHKSKLKKFDFFLEKFLENIFECKVDYFQKVYELLKLEELYED